MTAAHAAVFFGEPACMWNAIWEMRASVPHNGGAHRRRKRKDAGQRRNRREDRGLRSRATLSFRRMMAASHIMFTN